MFTKKTPDEKTGLEKTIDELIVVMRQTDETSDEYAKMADQLVKLYALKDVDNNAKKRVSPDQMLAVSANLLGILIIVGHERAHVVTSKALTFLRQAR